MFHKNKYNNYNNFHKALQKEQDPQAQKRLRAFYKAFYGEYRSEIVQYKTFLGRAMQIAGIDRILYKLTESGRIIDQLWMQEKVCSYEYSNLIFEYEKKSGNAGWAICEKEKSDYIVYYLDGTILVIRTSELREWLLDNLQDFKLKFREDTDNSNVAIPRYVVVEELDVKEYQLFEYWDGD